MNLQLASLARSLAAHAPVPVSASTSSTASSSAASSAATSSTTFVPVASFSTTAVDSCDALKNLNKYDSVSGQDYLYQSMYLLIY